MLSEAHGLIQLTLIAELGHISKNCKEEREERTVRPEVKCMNCQELGHRARDCKQERFDPFACKNCKKHGHTSRDCPEPRSAEGVECRRCHESKFKWQPFST